MATQEEARATVKKALDDYFRSEPAPTPKEARAFLVTLQQDIAVMVSAIDMEL